MPDQPLAEVFGFASDCHSDDANRHRRSKLCPFGNSIPNCNKDKANDPLGVCSVNTANGVAITCPIRFREAGLIVEDAADFFFSGDATWTSLPEIRLKEAGGRSAGNIDLVLVQYDDAGSVVDFGAIEIQAVYNSGNVRDPFRAYMQHNHSEGVFTWPGTRPRPDFLSSSRKRLVPQLLFKGSILRKWGKRVAIAIDDQFFATLPRIREVPEEDAEVLWSVYTLSREHAGTPFRLTRSKSVFTKYDDVFDLVTKPEAGSIGDFVGTLQTKLDNKLSGEPPSS